MRNGRKDTNWLPFWWNRQESSDRLVMRVGSSPTAVGKAGLGATWGEQFVLMRGSKET